MGKKPLNTHTHTCHVHTTVGHCCAHKQTSPSTKATSELKQILRALDPRLFTVLHQSSTNTRVSARVEQLTGSQSLLNEDTRKSLEPSHLKAHRTRIAPHHIGQQVDQYQGFAGVSAHWCILIEMAVHSPSLYTMNLNSARMKLGGRVYTYEISLRVKCCCWVFSAVRSSIHI